MDGVSFVIPAFNEELALASTLAAANLAREAFKSKTGLPSEIVLVDNCSTDKTAEIATLFGARVIHHSIRNISSVRNAGLREAAYNLIIAIDADCRIEENALFEIYEYMATGEYIGGSLNLRVESPKLSTRILARALQWFVLWKAGHNGAVFFFLRDEALAVGGFSEKHLVAEDSVFTDAMRARAKVIKKRFGRLSNVTVTTTDRKGSTLKGLIQIAPHVWRMYRGQEVDKKHFDYWYNPKR